MQLSETTDTDIGGVKLTSTGGATLGSVVRCRCYWDDYAPWSPILKVPIATVEGWVSQEFNRGNRSRPVSIFIEFGTEALRAALQAKVDLSDVTFVAILPLASGVTITLNTLKLLDLKMETRARVTGGIIPGLAITGRNMDVT